MDDDDSGGKGVQFAAQLARVADRRPCAAALHSAPNGGQQQQLLLCVAVKLRATLVHCIVNGAIQCVLRSPVPIVDVCAVRSSHDSDSAQQQLLVAVADGRIWRVTLPTRPLGALHPIALPQSAKDASCAHPGACRMELVSTLPGVQTVAHHLRRDGSSVAVFTSILSPTTLVWSSPGSARSDTDKPAAVELDALEAEQSTCALVLDGQQPVNHALLRWLFLEVVNTQASVLVLQGDVDGAVRFVLTYKPRSDTNGQQSSSATASASCTGALVEIRARVQFVVPFSSAPGASTASNAHGILVVGADGRAHLVQPPALGEHQHVPPMLPLAGLASVQLAAPIQSLVFLHWLECFVYCARGTTFAFRVSDLTQQRAPTGTNGTRVTQAPESSVKLPFPPGIVVIAVHEREHALTCVLASGRVLSMDRARVQETIARVLELSSSSDTAATSTRTTEGDVSLVPGGNETRVKLLLQRIADGSTAVATLRAHSDQLDAHLGALHAALQLQHHVATQGIESVCQCRLSLVVDPTGAFAESKALRLSCRIHVSKPDNVHSLACWLVSVHVRLRRQQVAAFVFPLVDRRTRVLGGEKVLQLPRDTLAQHEDGVLLVSCSLVFQPGDLAVDGEQEEPPLFSFAIPLVRNQACHLVRLSDILEEREIPMSHTTIRAAFRQDQDPLLLSSVTSIPQRSAVSPNEQHAQPQQAEGFALLPGWQLWSALSTHWDERPSFASLRWRDAQQQPQHALGELAPPLRFTMVFPACAFQELHVDNVAAIVLQVMQLPSSEAPRVRANCRSQRGGGRFWVGLQTCSGNVVVLRFALAEGTVLVDGELLRPLEIVLQCSDHEDLSAMRALLLESVARAPGHQDMSMPLRDVFAALSLETADLRESIEETMALAATVDDKIATQLRSTSSSSLCTHEVVRMLADLARIETRLLDLYWKCRHVLNKFVL